MIKRLFIGLVIALMLFSFTAFAGNGGSVSLEPYGEFFTYGTDTERLAEILSMSADELSDYCEANNIEYLAINKDNTKQIKLMVASNDFSSSLGNISGLSNAEISSLIPDITGVDGAKGEIIDRNGQKFIKVQFRSGDSGGEYSLIQYITVAAKKSYTLSFYTDIKESTDYTENTFNTLTSQDFNSTDTVKSDTIRYIVLAAMIIFGIACIAVTVSIVIDIRKSKKELE